MDDPSRLARLQAALQASQIPIFPISAVTGEGVRELLEALWQAVSRPSDTSVPAAHE